MVCYYVKASGWAQLTPGQARVKRGEGLNPHMVLPSGQTSPGISSFCQDAWVRNQSTTLTPHTHQSGSHQVKLVLTLKDVIELSLHHCLDTISKSNDALPCTETFLKLLLTVKHDTGSPNRGLWATNLWEKAAVSTGFPRGSDVENPSAMQETRIQALDQKGPRRREWQPTPAFLPGESPRQRIYTESDTTERLTVTYYWWQNMEIKHRGPGDILVPHLGLLYL